MQNARVPKFSHLNPTSNSSKKAQRKHILLQNILISHTHLTPHFPLVQSSAYLYGSGCKLLTSQDAHKRNLTGLGWGCWHQQELSSRNGVFFPFGKDSAVSPEFWTCPFQAPPAPKQIIHCRKFSFWFTAPTQHTCCHPWGSPLLKRPASGWGLGKS